MKYVDLLEVLYPTYPQGVTPVNLGGTGAIDAADARKNLGIPDTRTETQYPEKIATWSGNTLGWSTDDDIWMKRLRPIPKLLWDGGNASGGSDIVLNTTFGNYSLFAAEVSGYSDILISARLPLGGFNFVCGVGFGADASNVEGAVTVARLSYKGGDTFHVDGVQRINIKNGYIYGNPNITKIWAIV